MSKGYRRTKNSIFDEIYCGAAYYRDKKILISKKLPFNIIEILLYYKFNILNEKRLMFRILINKPLKKCYKNTLVNAYNILTGEKSG
jgi:hypothetical protein